MGEWTWLFQWFPLADVELMSKPIPTDVANVLVRTIRRVPDAETDLYEVRVAPHNVAPFRGGPWLRRFSREQLEHPGDEVSDFCRRIAEQIDGARY